MPSAFLQPTSANRVAFYDDTLEREGDLGLIRHRLDSLAHTRAVCGLRPNDELEYERLCERERALLDAFHQVVAQ
jgi:hypothetical protein